MDLFMKASAGVLITVIVSMILAKQGKDFSVLLILCVCGMVMSVAGIYIQKLLDFIITLMDMGQLNQDFIEIMFKTMGIGLLCEITCLICNDSGNAALGKSIQVLAAVVILCLCIPLFSKLLELVKEVLELV